MCREETKITAFFIFDLPPICVFAKYNYNIQAAEAARVFAPKLKTMNFFNTFRGKLLLVLAFLLIATLGVQFYLNYRMQKQNSAMLKAQDQAILTGISLGSRGITGKEYIQDVISEGKDPYFEPASIDRIKDVIVINDKWQVFDSLNPEYLPDVGEDGKIVYKNLADLNDLPPLAERGNRLGDDINKFPNANQKIDENTVGEAHAVPIQTSEGRWYVMVILKTDKSGIISKAAQPLIYTLVILLISTTAAIFLVWRFTRPIAQLSEAARRVAEGDLNFRLTDANSTDEMGRLSAQFNEMTAELAKNRKLETKLQEAEKSAVVGRLAAAIAHEIRNPLNYINLSLDHLRNKFKPEEAAKQETFEKLTTQLKVEVGRINRQISDFLSYSRPAKADLQPIELRPVIENSLHIVEPLAADCNIKISVVEAENVPKIIGDAEFLRSVFNNLFVNAVHSMEKNGGNLTVRVTPDGECVKIEISDTGCGITPENLAKIFEPYFSTKETGTGLGLAIVQKVVETHHGTITVASNAETGTAFAVKLPRAVED